MSSKENLFFMGYCTRFFKVKKATILIHCDIHILEQVIRSWTHHSKKDILNKATPPPSLLYPVRSHLSNPFKFSYELWRSIPSLLP